MGHRSWQIGFIDIGDRCLRCWWPISHIEKVINIFKLSPSSRCHQNHCNHWKTPDHLTLVLWFVLPLRGGYSFRRLELVQVDSNKSYKVCWSFVCSLWFQFSLFSQYDQFHFYSSVFAQTQWNHFQPIPLEIYVNKTHCLSGDFCILTSTR